MLENIESRITCRVEPWHIDAQYNHLAYHHIPNYLNQGRLALMRELGITDERLKENGLAAYVTEIEKIRCREQIPERAEIEIHSKALSYEKGPFIKIQQVISLNGKTAITSATTMCLVNLNSQAAAYHPEEIIKELTQAYIVKLTVSNSPN